MRKSHTERVEELEDSVWSVVQQKNEREYEDEDVGLHGSGKTGIGVRGRDMGIGEDT